MQQYNSESYKYSNNYAWPGITTILYNINSMAMIEQYGNHIIEWLKGTTDIGFAYKQGSFDQPASQLDMSQFTKVSILEDSINPWSEKSTSTLRGNALLLGSAGTFEVNGTNDWNGYAFPYVVALQNLNPDTEYTICGYSTVTTLNGSEFESFDIFFNFQQIRTLPDENKNVTWRQGTGWSDLSSTESASAIANINRDVSILNEMCNIELEFTINLSNNTEGGAAVYRGNGIIDIAPSTIRHWKFRSIAMHEMGHGLMQKVLAHTDKEMQFMEWATSLPKAKWMWLDSHNYPVISSSEGANIRDLYKRAAAYQVSTELETPAPSFYLKLNENNYIYAVQHGTTYDFGELPHNWTRMQSNIPWASDTSGWSNVQQYLFEEGNNGTTYDFVPIANNALKKMLWSVNGYNFRMMGGPAKTPKTSN